MNDAEKNSQVVENVFDKLYRRYISDRYCSCKHPYLSVMMTTNWLADLVRGSGPRILISTNCKGPIIENSVDEGTLFHSTTVGAGLNRIIDVNDHFRRVIVT